MRENRRKKGQGCPQRLNCHIERSRNVFLNSSIEASTPLSLTKALLFGEFSCYKVKKILILKKPEQNNMLLVSSKICLFTLFLVFTACQPKQKEKTAKQFESVLWEILSTDTTQHFTDSLQNWASAQADLKDAVIKRWKDHYIIFAQSNDSLAVKTSLTTSFKNKGIKFYNHPYYHFERGHCADTSTVKEFEYYILTANLVADKTLQKEYMQYHKTQYQEWPEIAQGFCNASFQHLIMFRNGKQLMLIIAIPKGKTLDELNPLTEKDNPRVKEWNAIMAKYQEGIPGARKNETWVFFE